MSELNLRSPAVLAVLTLAEIKAATQSFDSGQTNASDALDAIMFAIQAYRHAAQLHRDAA